MMGLSAGVITGIVIQHTGVTLLARALGNSGIPITKASLTSIAYIVSDLNAGVSLGTGTFTVASSVFDSLQQTDPRWTKDGPLTPGPDGLFGYNFLAVLPASLFPASTLSATLAPQPWPMPVPNQVQADVTFTPVSGEVFKGVWRWKPIPAYS